MLPRIEDGARDLSPRRIAGHANVASHADAFSGGCIERHERLVGIVIDARQLDHLFAREAIDPLAEERKRDRALRRRNPTARSCRSSGSIGRTTISAPSASPTRSPCSAVSSSRGTFRSSPRPALARCAACRAVPMSSSRARKLSDEGGELALPGTQLTAHGQATVGPTAVTDQRSEPQIDRGELPIRVGRPDVACRT
jgi:hypothetical protein